jgi:hypothetical protein
MNDKIYRTKIAVVSIGQKAKAWQRMLERELIRTRNISDSPKRADALVVIIDKSFPSLIKRAERYHDDCFKAIRETLTAGKMLLPVRVENAAIPTADTLPDSIRSLAQFQAIALDSKSSLPGVAARLVVSTKTLARPYVPAKTSDPRVFLSYRRDDSWYWASLLARALTQRLGAYNVFFDIGSIAPGRNFDKEIENSIQKSTDFVILVGQAFLAHDHSGRCRLYDPKDYVRREITAAIKYQKKIHIVLTNDAPLPGPKQLPQSIALAFKETITLQLTDWREADSVAVSILSGPPLLKGVRSINLTRSLFNTKRKPFLSSRTGDSPRFLTQKQKANRFLMAAVPPLAALDWQPIDLSKSKGQLIMTRPDQESYRFSFDFKNFELILEEKARGFSRLGLKGWIKRSAFPITPDAPDIEVLRPSDMQLEAMENPGAYLDRIGRLNLDMISKPPMRRTQVDRFLRAANQPGRRALDQHTQELSKIRAKGGILALDCIHSIFLGEKVVGRAVAVNPRTGMCVAASTDGAYIIDVLTGNSKPIGPRSYTKHLSFSKNGMLAITDDKERLSVYNSHGKVIIKRRSPYSALKRYTRPRKYFKEPSWSTDEKRIAIGAPDRVWIFNLNDQEFDQIYLQQDEELGRISAKFIPNSDDILTMHKWNLCRVSCRRDKVLQQFDFSAGSVFFDPKPSVLSFETAGFDPACMALSHDGGLLAIGGNDAQMVLANPKTLLPTAMRIWHTPLVDSKTNCMIEALAFSPDGRRLASVANDNRLIVGDPRNGDPLAEGHLTRETALHGFPIKHDVCWSLDGDRIIVVNMDGHIDIWNTGFSI